MTDIVERLRKGAAYLKFYDCKDAADEIDRLRSRNAELEGALANVMEFAVTPIPPINSVNSVRDVAARINKRYDAIDKARALLDDGLPTAADVRGILKDQP